MMSNYQQLRIVLDTQVGLPELQYNRIKYTYKCGHDAQFSLEMIRKLRQTKGVARCYFRKRKSGAILRLILVDKKI
ncbi:Uncharacterised protein [Canicola haemoglobinophilus]|uniref:Uncharacterized protein n=1 Tax=Canicola haemoglobinophilus TaxID=733 RepID=A0AB38HBE0_9PAST|nr:Uncharacterised protein [Canicola haemoglobinophilus]STO68954.1 Uncharacterised protein [Canicola haemoglobinophilus]